MVRTIRWLAAGLMLANGAIYPGTRSVGLAVCGLVVGFAAVTLPVDVEAAGGVLLVHAGSLAGAALAIAMPQGRAPHGLGRAAFETALRVSVHLS